MVFRKRKRPEPELDKLLGGYRATAPPSSPTSAIATLRCWNCKKPNVFDARHRAPTRCAWCRAVL